MAAVTPRAATAGADLEEAARALARAHGDPDRADDAVSGFDGSPIPRALQRAHRALSATTPRDAEHAKAAEWFLDNYYLLRRVARQVVDDLPRGFLRHLPRLKSRGAPRAVRIEAIAQALVATGRELDPAALTAFVHAYQERAALRIAELWALPVMLRTALLQSLLQSLSSFVPAAGTGTVTASADGTRRPDAGDAVGRCVRGLRVLSEVDWKRVFEETSRVESILRDDPTRTYALMDFASCDAYRKAVEELAWATGHSEENVARRAIALATEAPGMGRRREVGFYLVAEGRRQLEATLGYRARGVERLRRAVLERPAFVHISSLALMTALPLAVLSQCLFATHASPARVAVAVIMAAVPVSVLAVSVTQWWLADLLRPRVLPKLDLSKGIPDDARTLVVIPTLLGRTDDVDDALRQIEVHYLANPEPGLQFALLTDDVDSATRDASTALVDSASEGIMALNVKHGVDGRGPFLLLHRQSKWNAAEGRYMGWERKRGKLEELNRLLRGDTGTSYTRVTGDRARLENIRFVITLDNDTQLPIGSAHRLVGLFAHPLNKAVFDEAHGRIVSGYSIVQPRVEISPSSARQSWFARIYAGDVGYDIYARACSDLYQDLYGAGIYVGKGIYDVDAFTRSVAGRVPENALASHDLFEGLHGRVALASDVVLFEGYPSHYAAYVRRLHRWVRGDWQLVPWLFPRPPSATGRALENPLEPLDRWKILDNLRRSLVAPAFVALFVSAWTWLPGSPVAWTLAALALLVTPVLPSLVAGGPQRAEAAGRYALGVTFLAHEASVVVDAVARVAVRMLFTRKRLLEWTTASQTARGIGSQSGRALFWATMASSPLVAVGALLGVAWTRPSALAAAAPVVALWAVAPEVARWASLPRGALSRALRERTVGAGARAHLRRLARRTWLFFETFVGPNDQWLPIDNHQERPHEQTAHRTSPTNIGMMFLSTLSAYDLGYIGPSELSLRVRNGLDSVSRLEHYQGHLLNWYDTVSLEPLLPRYVSTVDSGNFAGSLIALKEGCRGALQASVLRPEDWDGLLDAVGLVEDALGPEPRALTAAANGALERMRKAAERARSDPHAAYGAARELGDDLHGAVQRELLSLIEAGAYRQQAGMLRVLQRSSERLTQHVVQLRREMDSIMPWLGLAADARALGLELPVTVRLEEVAAAATSLREGVDAWERARRRDGGFTGELAASAARLRTAAASGADYAAALCSGLGDLAARAEQEARGIDFRLVFDAQRRLFHIGYNVTVDRPDANHYDLLASEARLASFLAIVKRDVPESHWYTLGRPMTAASGSPLLLSWGGTMFEYLMPTLLMRSEEGTLLRQTYEQVVNAQRAYAERERAPWGISESAHARLDARGTYQYQSFGVPGLGFKRGLEDDLVVAPYASFLALSVRPRAVLDNATRLEAMGALGQYGMFEAVDFRAEYVTPRHPYAVVRSYMAHHQGMLLVAINNLLHEEIMVERFHADGMVQAGEILLNERPPTSTPAEWPLAETSHELTARLEDEPSNYAPWSPDPRRPAAFVVSNGSLTSLAPSVGGGGLVWRGLALTRYQPDAVRSVDGSAIYLRDESRGGKAWVAGSRDSRAVYSAHKVELHRRVDGISARVEVAVAAEDDVEIRHVTLRNEGAEECVLLVTSVARPALLPARDATVHPAFANLFLESDWREDVEALVFTRRARTDDDEHVALVHRLVRDDPSVTLAEYETDRAAFIGRAADDGAIADAATNRARLGRHTGAVLDPVACIGATVRLRPKETVSLAFVTAVGEGRGPAEALARRYGSMHAVRWALRDAEPASRRRLQRGGIGAALLPALERLLSALLFIDPELRPNAEQIREGRPSRRKLWGRGISGDDPIVLVRVHDAQVPLLRELVQGQAYLRSCGFRFDIVCVDENASGYSDVSALAIRGLLVQCGVDLWRDRQGGVFVIGADQLPAGERALLEASARVVLDTRDGSLVDRMAKQVPAVPRLPWIEATHPTDADPQPVTLPELSFGNEFGGFTTDGREYVIAVRPGSPTPAPWCNVLANDRFGCLVSESALGCTWSLNSGENRLTPWRNDPIMDTPSEVVYLRDEETAAVWSPTPAPAGRSCATLVRHGAGYTTYTRESHGLLQELTVFVPPGASLKVARLRVKNTRSRHRRLTATYYAEWVLGSQREEQRAYVTTAIERGHGCVLSSCAWNDEFADRVAFVAADRELHGFTADRREFLGDAGGYDAPEGLARWGLSGVPESGGDPCAALQIHLELAPGEEGEVHFLLGQAESRGAALDLVARYREPAAIESAWRELHAFWDDLLGKVRVATPEPAMDLMLNRWLLYQTVASRLFARTGFYQASGAFGFRDQLQDILALTHAARERARAHILEAASHQFEEGDVLHWWHPPEGRGVRTRCSDDMAWLPFVTAEYVRATGDASILQERRPFLTGAPLQKNEHDRYAKYETARTSAPLLEHCRRALERALTEGSHGLPLMGDGDWNDGMNRIGAAGVGESVWLAWFLVATMGRFASLCLTAGDAAESAKWRARASTLRTRVEACAWDGAWYVRAFHDDGSTVGSHRSRECQIDSLAQSWAVLAGGSDEARVGRALDSVESRLVREEDRLVLLLAPPFDAASHNPGYIRAYPPGVRENGGQYTHAAAWLGWAYAARGGAEGAERVFRLLNPVLRTCTGDALRRYRIEPYVLAGDVYGAPPFVGRGGWSWYTGAAAWVWRLGVEAILGIRLEDGDLLVDPCIPEEWTGFEAWVRHADRDLHILVDNPSAGGREVTSATIDGVALHARPVRVRAGDLSAAACVHEVRIRLGTPDAVARPRDAWPIGVSESRGTPG
jgi:cyclic beta-1,2-glucan synthetase